MKAKIMPETPSPASPENKKFREWLKSIFSEGYRDASPASKNEPGMGKNQAKTMKYIKNYQKITGGGEVRV